MTGRMSIAPATIRPVSEFDTVTENAALKEAIVARIAAEGGISFFAFMSIALYHPTLGYYAGRRDPIGREADYVTSPELSPLFGAMIGRQLREMWEQLGSPPVFDVVEAGAGSGVMVRDVLSWARRNAAPLFTAMHYAVVEPHAAAMYRQRELLSDEGLVPKVSWAGRDPARRQRLHLLQRAAGRDARPPRRCGGWPAARGLRHLGRRPLRGGAAQAVPRPHRTLQAAQAAPRRGLPRGGQPRRAGVDQAGRRRHDPRLPDDSSTTATRLPSCTPPGARTAPCSASTTRAPAPTLTPASASRT